MKTNDFVDFINRYYLKGMIEKGKWTITPTSIHTRVINDTKDTIADVIFNVETGIGETKEIAIGDTSRLLSMLNVMEDDIEVNVEDTYLSITDQNQKCKALLMDLTLLPKKIALSTDLKPNLTIVLDTKTLQRVIKSLQALNTIQKSQTAFVLRDSTVYMIINYDINKSDNITIPLVKGWDGVFDNDIPFSTDLLLRIFNCNKDSQKATISLVTTGEFIGTLLSNFETTNCKITYFTAGL